MKQSYHTKLTPEQLAQVGKFKATVLIASPGRVNLIGEHTDYNNGFVMPTAIDKTIQFYLKANGSPGNCTVNSLNFNKEFRFNLEKPDLNGPEWTRYILGVVEEIKKLGKKLKGFDCLMLSDLPAGAGISSSAALECGLAFGLNELFSLSLEKSDIVTLAQKAEHNYVGTQCGIMDQFASVMSEEGQVIRLDCKSLDYELIPFEIHPYKLVLLNTNVSHNLASSEYNTRRKECETGVAILKQHDPHVRSLRDASLAQLELHKEEFPPVVYNRCAYVIEENARVLKAAEALKEGDLQTLGELMYASHEGLQYKYQVSCSELDFLTEYSRDNPDVLGCRMMGGGFGGCTINLIHETAADDYIAAISKAYKQEFNLHLSSFITQPAPGTRRITL